MLSCFKFHIKTLRLNCVKIVPTHIHDDIILNNNTNLTLKFVSHILETSCDDSTSTPTGTRSMMSWERGYRKPAYMITN